MAEQCELNIDVYGYTCDVQYFDLCWARIDLCNCESVTWFQPCQTEQQASWVWNAADQG
jgi:hypothetical protein